MVMWMLIWSVAIAIDNSNNNNNNRKKKERKKKKSHCTHKTNDTNCAGTCANFCVKEKEITSTDWRGGHLFEHTICECENFLRLKYFVFFFFLYLHVFCSLATDVHNGWRRIIQTQRANHTWRLLAFLPTCSRTNAIEYIVEYIGDYIGGSAIFFDAQNRKQQKWIQKKKNITAKKNENEIEKRCLRGQHGIILTSKARCGGKADSTY